MASGTVVKNEQEQGARVVGSTSLAEPRATAPAVLPDASGGMFERLLRDPDITPDRLERFMALWERTEAKKAEMAFNRALAAAQKGMRPVAADSRNKSTNSDYASYEALDRALRPIYTSHGLAVSFPGTEDSPLPEHVRVICKVTHDDGHVEKYHVDMPADGKGAKGGDAMTKTHAVGSALSYGQRYLLKGIFNVAIGEDDDDGNAAGGRPPQQAPQVPAGFDEWWDDLTATADEGTAAIERFWIEANKNPKTKAFLAYATKNKGRELNALKAKAARVAAS